MPISVVYIVWAESNSMTKLQAGTIMGVVAVGGIAVLLQNQDQSRLREENHSLRQQVEQVTELQADNDRFSNLVAQATNSQSASFQSQELSRLRREVTALRRQ